MKKTLACLAFAALGAAFAAPASALPVSGPAAIDRGTALESVQFFENADRAGRRGLQTMRRNSDLREPASTGTTKHPNRPAAQDIYGQSSGGERARNRR